MLKVLIGIFFIFNLSVFAQKCIYGVDRNSIIAEWEAFKTKKKISVSGTFNNMNVSINEKALSLKELLEGSMALIDARYVFTNNKERDKTLLQSFFAYFAPSTLIKAIVTDVSEKDGTLNLVLVMNGQSKSVPMEFSIINGNFHAIGDIDVVKDFNLGDGLDALNKACFDLHEGITWPKVILHLSMKMGRLCKDDTKKETKEVK